MTPARIAELRELEGRLRERLQREASRRNSAYDHFGDGWTPQKTDPDVFAAADAIASLLATVHRAMMAEAKVKRQAAVIAAADEMRQQYELFAGIKGTPLAMLHSATAYDRARALDKGE